MSAAPDTASSASTDAGQNLRDLLKSGAPWQQIQRHLDALDLSERLRQVLMVKRSGVKALYDRFESAPPATVDEFVPPSTTGKTVIYEGRNSLLLFSRFQKRFFRTESGVVVGYNHQTWQFITGPGYFVVQAADGKPPVPSELYIDYITEPPTIPEGWPAYKPNSRGFSRGVYFNMHDYMRRVATGVYVGKAYRAGEDIDAHFSLTLPPPPAPETAA